MSGTNTSFDWSWVIALLIIAGIFNNGFGGFGGNNAGFTALDLDSRFNSRDIFNTNTAVLTTANETQKEVLSNRYENALGVANLQKDILVGNQIMQGNLDSCCCSIKSAIRDDGEKTRALITANYEATLLEKINDLKSQVNNAEQTQAILNNLGRFHIYPSCSCGYGSCTTNLI